MPFNKAIEKIINIEGGYVNDPQDSGGETMAGISRRYNPQWVGWELVDQAKSTNRTPTVEEMWQSIHKFYLDHYWTPIRGNELLNDDVSLTLFDTAVHMGTCRAGLYLQQSLNLLNRDKFSWPEILEDGRIGPVTIATLSLCLNEPFGSQHLINVIQTLRGMHYIQRVRQKPSQERYLRGWLNRRRKLTGVS